ncbi:MAG: lmo0937 family membrane protein [Ignavibacteriales bacterium]|nr:MAG: lmo0937 family membrane protein [Ignavibacteriales bacterium]
MFYTIAVDLLVLWVLGLFASYTFGGIIYILPVIAIAMIFLNIINERRILHL